MKTQKIVAAAIGTLLIVGALTALLTQDRRESSTTQGPPAGVVQSAALAAAPSQASPTPSAYTEEIPQVYQYYSTDGNRYDDPDGEREHENRQWHEEWEHEEDDD